MARKPVTTREDMIEGAFQLIRKRGHEALTARNLAKELGCSTQPVMYQFPSLSELKELAYEKTDRYHTEYILSAEGFLESGLRYIQFAREEPDLFRFLFQSGHFKGMSIRDMLNDPEASEVMRYASSGLAIPAEKLALVFEALYITVHGYADLIANNALEYDPESIEKTLTAIAEGLMGKE